MNNPMFKTLFKNKWHKTPFASWSQFKQMPPKAEPCVPIFSPYSTVSQLFYYSNYIILSILCRGTQRPVKLGPKLTIWCSRLFQVMCFASCAEERKDLNFLTLDFLVFTLDFLKMPCNNSENALILMMATVGVSSGSWRETEKIQCAIDRKKQWYHHNYQPHPAVQRTNAV